jgi:CubicO group peptidase (beta-lactamase class C family)
MTSVDEDAENPFVHGHCEPGFARVRAGFARMLASGFEVGAALAVYVGAHPVVDLWGGHADAARTRPWERDTIVNLYSVGKAVGAICVLRLVEAGVLDLDAPVATYWPEFAQAGKARVVVRHLLTHQAALPAIARALPSDAWSHRDVMTAALAAQAPWWEPGAGHGYHVNSQGFLIGEVVRPSPGRRSAHTCARASPAPPRSISSSASAPSTTHGARR